MDLHTLEQYAPWLIAAYVFLKDKKLFATPTELAEIKSAILNEVEQKFLSLIAFRQFEKRIDEQFNTDAERMDRMDKKLDRILDVVCDKGGD